MSEQFAARVRRLRAAFIATFPDRVRALKELSVGLDLDRLGNVRTEVHQLRGSAGMYHLDEVFAAACKAEAVVDQMLEAMRSGRRPDLNLDEALAPLLAALSRVQE